MATKEKSTSETGTVNAAGTALATQQGGALMVSDQAPDHIKRGNRGSEQVTADEMVIPRLGLLQALSPEVNKRDPKYIQGAEQGMLYNSATGELYGERVVFVPVFFRKEFVVWKDRDSGGGFNGAFPDEVAAVQHISTLENVSLYEAVETHQHFGMIVDEDGSVQEIVLSLNKSKLKASRKLNTFVQMSGSDRWARGMHVFSMPDKSDKGDFFNYGVSVAGWVSKEVYDKGESLYAIVKAGKADVDRSEGGDAGSKPAAPAEGSNDPTDL